MAGALDGRKFNGGHSTKGVAGRKSSKLEENVKAAIIKAAKRNPGALGRIWDKVIAQAEKGSERHIKILFEYYYGRPVENIKMETKGMELKLTKTVVIHETGPESEIQ